MKKNLHASPDRFVDCKCHGSGMLEVKYPMTAASEKPSAENVYLVVLDGVTVLNNNHTYYGQIQMQSVVTNNVA